jgi:hypothetical protein
MRRETADITLRAQRDAVSKRPGVYAENFGDPRKRCVLLIHGYNVSEPSAVAVLGPFREALAHFAPALKEDTFTCTWAGDRPVPLKPAVYPLMLKSARESAETLSYGIKVWYERDTAAPELVIVAHSLGCRLVLETLALIALRGRPARLKKLTVILMAAAVPTQHIAPAGHLHAALAAADVVVALYSTADRVLKWVFGAGQTAAADGWFPEAVGLRGHPPGTRWTTAKEMRAFDHRDYWAELETAELICRILGFPIRPWDVSRPLSVRKQLSRYQPFDLPFESDFGPLATREDLPEGRSNWR